MDVCERVCVSGPQLRERAEGSFVSGDRMRVRFASGRCWATGTGMGWEWSLHDVRQGPVFLPTPLCRTLRYFYFKLLKRNALLLQNSSKRNPSLVTFSPCH